MKYANLVGLFEIGVSLVAVVLGCSRSESIIVIEGPTKVLSEPDCSFHRRAEMKVITTLNKGASVQVLDIIYPKDCMVYKIKLTDGRIGFITYGDEFREVGFPHGENVFVIIEGPKELTLKPDSINTPGNTVITTLQKGDSGKLIDGSYWKGSMFYKIRLDDGTTGYVELDDRIKVVEGQKK